MENKDIIEDNRRIYMRVLWGHKCQKSTLNINSVSLEKKNQCFIIIDKE